MSLLQVQNVPLAIGPRFSLIEVKLIKLSTFTNIRYLATLVRGKRGSIKENNGIDRREHQGMSDHIKFVFCRNALAGVVKSTF